MPSVSDLSDPNAVHSAIRDFDLLGRDAFLDHYGFGHAKRWYLLYHGSHYDSKAIVGAALGYQFGHALRSNDFTGGEATVVRTLRALQFTVVALEITDESSRLPEEVPATFPEGNRVTVTVNRAERSAAARAACIEVHGYKCSICEMEFGLLYGPEFEGLIHVHHLNALARRTDASEVNPRTDLTPVCPNCHAAIHFGGEYRTIEEVRVALSDSRSRSQ